MTATAWPVPARLAGAGRHSSEPVVYRVEEGLDARTAESARRLLADGYGRSRVVIDLSEVSFVDSRGVGVLAGAVCRIREHGGVVALVVGGARVARALAAAGFLQLVPVCTSMADARRWLAAEPAGIA